MMDARFFFDNFGTIAEAPGGMPRIRELVRDQAVRGHLVAQDCNDENAETLLRSIKTKRLVEFSSLVEPVANEELWPIPSSWHWVRLKEICDFAVGRTPATKDATFWSASDGYHWVSIGDMPDGGEVHETARLVTTKARDEIFRGDPDPVGTLLMSFKLTIGKMARLAVPAFHNEAIISIRAPFDELEEYLFRALPLLTRTGNSKAAIMGSTLNKYSLSNLLVPLPPLGEQDRLVAKMDELMTLCDSVESERERRDAAAARLAESAIATMVGT